MLSEKASLVYASHVFSRISPHLSIFRAEITEIRNKGIWTSLMTRDQNSFQVKGRVGINQIKDSVWTL